MRRRLLTLLLALTMLLSLLTMNAAAAELPVEEGEIASGYTGDLIWTLTEDGTLTINTQSGSANMISFGPYGSAPWYAYHSDITSVVIGDGVKSLGRYAFLDCSNMTSITIPDSVTTINADAFTGCTSLSSIVIDENSSVYSLVDGVLFNSDKTELILYPQGKSGTSYTIPDGVTSLADSAFFGCENLTSISIPDSLTDFDGSAFAGCSNFSTISISSGSSVYSLVDGVLFSSDQTQLILYPPGKSDTSYSIPSGVTSLAYEAFYECNNLTSITLPTTLSSLGGRSFYTCTSLTSINVESGSYYYVSVDGVLYNWTKTILIQYPAAKSGASFEVPDSVTRIRNFAFYCSNLEEISIPDSVTYMENYVFQNCTKLKEVEIPSSVEWDGYYMFYGCTSLTSVTLPDTLDTIKSFMFYGCTSLTSIDLPDTITSLGDSSFTYCTSLKEITIPDSVEEFGYNVFAFCSSLTSVTLPDNANFTEIPFYSFADCSSLESIVFPESVTSVREYVFQNCTSLEAVTLSDNLTYLDAGAFYRCSSLKSITIPSGVTCINSYAFYDCTSLTEIVFECTYPTLIYNAFGNVTATAYYPEDNNDGNTSGWTSSRRTNYSGTLTWESYDPDELYSLSLYSNGSLNRILPVFYGNTISVSSLPALTRQDAVFNGWIDAYGNLVTEDITITGDLTLYASWSVIFTFGDDDGAGYWSWASDYIYACYEEGIISGDENGDYNPGSSLTRAQAAKIIAEAFDLTVSGSSSTEKFADDTGTGNWSWASDYIYACAEAGIINGYAQDDGTYTYELDQAVTRVELAKMIAIANDLSLSAATSSFSDVASTHWGLKYIEACAAAGIITGYEQSDGTYTFLPSNEVNRAEAATMIARALDLV